MPGNAMVMKPRRRGARSCDKRGQGAIRKKTVETSDAGWEPTYAEECFVGKVTLSANGMRQR